MDSDRSILVQNYARSPRWQHRTEQSPIGSSVSFSILHSTVIGVTLMKYYVLALLFLLLAWYVVQEDNEIPIEMEIKNVAANLIKNVATGEVRKWRLNKISRSIY